jgi:DNA-binding NarL/FixJ family response regulator
MAQKIIKLFLLDDDPIFRLGFATAIEAFRELQIIAQFDRAEDVLSALEQQVPDLLVLEINLGNLAADRLSGWQLCQQLKTTYPSLPILILSSNLDEQQILALRALEVRGYCPKGTNIDTLVDAIRLVSSGQFYWQVSNLAPNNSTFSRWQIKRRARWISRLRQSGIGQIEESLREIETQLTKPNLTTFDWFYWSGRKRELLASRWLVDRLLPVDIMVIQERTNPDAIAPQLEPKLLPQSTPLAIESQQSIVNILCDRTLNKIRAGSENLTKTSLEIDVLQSSKKLELFYIIIERLKKLIEELNFLNLDAIELNDKIDIVLQQLWQISTIGFLQRYYQQELPNNKFLVEIIEQNLIDFQTDFLPKIFFSLELFAYLLRQKLLTIDNVEYRIEAPESLDRAEQLLQNLLVQIANGVMQVNLNNFSDSETSKYNLYQKNYRTSREIANFRNELAWRVRQNRYFQEPKAIFESQYRLFYFNGIGITQKFIYAPRTEELEKLRGIPWLVTIAIETRDAIAPRMRSLIAFVGSGVVYFLTQVIGRGIGLIGKGILQGIGNSFSENRYGKDRSREK